MLPGWHAPEQHQTGRWTTGDALLPIAVGSGPLFLDIEVLAAGPYLERDAA